MPKLTTVALDYSVVATSIYGDFPHAVSTTALVLEPAVRAELSAFLQGYASYLGIKEGEQFFRLDAYVAADTISIIEVNVETADGWGVALNLWSAAGIKSDVAMSQLPRVFPTFPGDLRQREFELAEREFAKRGHTAVQKEFPARQVDMFDNKMYLARYSALWKGVHVRIPTLYTCENCRWDEVPDLVYLKFANKFAPEAVSARYSAKPRWQLGKAKQMRKLFEEGGAVAQEYVPALRTADGDQVQVVCMGTASQVVTGYIQIADSTRSVINDKGTVKGVLYFE